MYNLSKKDPKKVEELLSTPEVIDKLPDAGDGNGVYLSEGTQADFEEWEKEQSGLNAFLRKIGLKE